MRKRHLLPKDGNFDRTRMRTTTNIFSLFLPFLLLLLFKMHHKSVIQYLTCWVREDPLSESLFMLELLWCCCCWWWWWWWVVLLRSEVSELQEDESLRLDSVVLGLWVLARRWARGEDGGSCWCCCWTWSCCFWEDPLPVVEVDDDDEAVVVVKLVAADEAPPPPRRVTTETTLWVCSQISLNRRMLPKINHFLNLHWQLQ